MVEFYGICPKCGWRGKEEECQHMEETRTECCISRHYWYICPQCGSEGIDIKTDASAEELLSSLYTDYAKRALLGGVKGKLMIEQLRRSNPELADAIMGKAKEELEMELKD